MMTTPRPTSDQLRGSTDDRHDLHGRAFYEAASVAAGGVEGRPTVDVVEQVIV